MRASIRRATNAHELFVNLVQRELRGKFKTTTLGWLWSLFNPLAQVLIFTAVVHFIFRVHPDPGANGLDSFPVWVLCGIITWNYFTAATTMALNSLTSNANLVQKSAFPRALLVLGATAAQAITSLIEIGVLLVLLVVLGVFPFAWLPVVILAWIFLVMFSTGFGLLLSIANVYFRDASHLMAIVFQVWFYATPVIYPLSQVRNYAESGKLPEWLWVTYNANPMVHLVEVVRDALYYQRFPPLLGTTYAVAVSLLVLVLGWTVFHRFEPRLAEEI